MIEEVNGSKVNKKKILIISQEFPPCVGGAGVVAYQNAVGLSKLGHDVTIVTRDWDNIKIDNKFKLIRVGGIKKLLFYRLNPNSVRPGIYDDYWFKMANYAIWNKHKMKAFKYFGRLSLKEKTIILIKMLFPFSFYHRKLK